MGGGVGQQGGHRPVSSQRDEVALGECEIPRCILVHTQHLQTGQEAHAQARWDGPWRQVPRHVPAAGHRGGGEGDAGRGCGYGPTGKGGAYLTLLSGLALVWLITRRGAATLKAHLLKAAPKEAVTILQPKQWASAAKTPCGTTRETQRGSRLQIPGLAVVSTLMFASKTHLLASPCSVVKMLSQVAADAHAASRSSATFAFLPGGMTTGQTAWRAAPRW